MALKHRSLETLLLTDTPQSTGTHWMMPDICRFWARTDLRLSEWSWQLLGCRDEEFVIRNYRPLLDALTARTGILLGGVPLGLPRPLSSDPGYVSEEDRALYQAHPLVSTRIVNGVGHNIPKYARGVILDAIRRITSYSEQFKTAQ